MKLLKKGLDNPERRQTIRLFLTCALVMCVVMGVSASFTGMWLTDDNPYRSYTLQACSWLEGRLDLGQDYPWLELAIVDGKYYVSFPPFPSMVLLPFAAVFGVNTPDHWISLAFTLVGILYAIKLYRALTGNLNRAEEAVLFLFLGNGYLFISMQGWVWYLAQSMAFCLSLMALYCAVIGQGGWSLTYWACAVGCRPMVIVYFPFLCMLIVHRWKECQGKWSELWKKVYWLLPALVIACVYMGLNQARFGSPFEFGHNYLPEFVRAEEGQFSLTYLEKNIGQMLRLPKTGGENGALVYDPYDCMAFWLIAPIWIEFFLAWIYGMCKKRTEWKFELLALPFMLAAHGLIICSHRTLGGFQFGNRYVVDMLPFVFCGMLMFRPDKKTWAAGEKLLFALGFSINLIGTVAAYNHWI